MIKYNTNIPLTKKQQLVAEEYLYNDAYKDVCFYGSTRSGKTFLLFDYFFQRAIAYPKSYQVFVRKFFTDLNLGLILQTMPVYFDIITKQNAGVSPYNVVINGDPLITYNSSMHILRFYNGSEIRFVGLDSVSNNSSATDKVLSTEYITIDLEEGRENNFEVVEKLQGRLATKVQNPITGKYCVPKFFTTLNPGTFDDWDYLYFQKGINPKSKEQSSEEAMLSRASIHFSIFDNLENIDAGLIERLKNLSPNERRRFLEGAYGDNFDGEIFKTLAWEALPPIQEFDRILIYNDPSYKSSAKNDYKASVAIGRRNGAYWVIWGEAMQCTTTQMVLNNFNILCKLKELGCELSVPHYFENAGMPDDFQDVVHNFAVQNGWVCPFKLDGRQKGDKYARIESALVPLNEQGKLFFNSEMKETRFGSLLTSQFLSFKSKMAPTEHDDIPDAVHGGITLLNQPELQTGGISQFRRTSRITF